MSTSPSSERPTRRGRETLAAIDAAARKLIAEKGFLNVSVADIAAESGRSAASFYNYYESREHMLARWAERFRDKARRRAHEAFDPRLTHREQIYREARAHVTTYRESLAEMIGVFQLAMISKDFARYWRELCQPAVDLITTMIQSAQREGYCRGMHPVMAATAIVSLLNQYCYEHYSTNGLLEDAEDEAVIRVIADLWYHAIYWQDDPDDQGCASSA
ncbi:Transcriptional regulator [gamma proteobacterium HdN1]|nr:Transcriptional regulator [gamma proteobacterium HdN1]